MEKKIYSVWYSNSKRHMTVLTDGRWVSLCGKIDIADRPEFSGSFSPADRWGKGDFNKCRDDNCKRCDRKERGVA